MFCSGNMFQPITIFAAYKVAFFTNKIFGIFWHFLRSKCSIFLEHKKMPFYYTHFFKKNMCSQTKIIFFAFTSYGCISNNSYISEKLIGSLLKNGHFKNVQFRKIADQIFPAFFVGLHFCGNFCMSNKRLFG